VTAQAIEPPGAERTDMTMTTETTHRNSRLRVALQRWPVLVGLAFAAFIAVGLHSGVELSKVLAASAVVYLGASAFKRRGAAWPVFWATFVIIGAGTFFDFGFDPAWAVLAAGILLLVYGLVRGAIRPPEGLPLQTLAMLGYGGAAVIALFVNPIVGSYLVAAGLLGHAAWDGYHHWRQKVVARSMAEFCLVLDTALAVTIIVVTARA
jgi:hypothetical protein